MYTTFITTSQLADHLNDPLWILVDCRFDLAAPGWGRDSYVEGHIPGAVYAHLDEDLSGPRTPQTGRHPLPDQEVMAARLSAWGIGPGKQVVVYDTAGGAFAARLWWMLHYYGHAAAAILEGGFGKWASENHPLGRGLESPRSSANFVVDPHPEMVIDVRMIEEIRLDPAWKLIDARSAVRFRGEQEPIDPVRGHIPGAINRFHGENLSPEGVLLPSRQLIADFRKLLGDTPMERTAVYCGSGVTSCFHIAVLAHLGLGMPRLYAGSWSEWIRDPKRPIATA